MKGTHSKESQIGALSELDSEITDFVEKLNLKTQFVVSCFTYFRIQDEVSFLLTVNFSFGIFLRTLKKQQRILIYRI